MVQVQDQLKVVIVGAIMVIVGALMALVGDALIRDFINEFYGYNETDDTYDTDPGIIGLILNNLVVIYVIMILTGVALLFLAVTDSL